MNQTFRYILIALGVLLGGFIVWYFSNLVAYILISAVLSFIGRPIVEILGSIKIRKRKIPISIRALVTLLLIWMGFIAFFRFIIPLVAHELGNLSQIDTESIVTSLNEPIVYIESVIAKYKVDGNIESTVVQFVNDKLLSVFNVSFLTNFFTNIAGTLGNIFLALFSITFITFFFLRDENLFAESLLTLVPDKHVEAFSHALSSTRRLLVRYFIGILIQVTGIFTIVTCGLTIFGVGFSHSILIGLIAATLNIIPYLGPVLGGVIGIILGIATHLDLDFYSQLLPLIGKMSIVFVAAQLTDNFVFQPFIFSNSVNAHPLEIFLVIMIAGSTAGIPGMILAVPIYTILRVFAKEFFNKFKVVKKLTRKIE
ncbi:MAG: AI-2E family transporter [Bacteroidales bacterium]|nr:AI-2E family transporter [Bacteroidales bacterium]MBN2818131.1 AI-2E family transporter [Bacteroidales bacterium]